MRSKIRIPVKEAKFYSRRFRDKTFVIKLGGKALEDEAAQTHIVDQCAKLCKLGMRVVLVHGGGPDATNLMVMLGKEVKFVRGLRYTDAETLRIVGMAFAWLNVRLVSLLNAYGARAVGLSGADNEMVIAKRKPELGFVGEVWDVNTRILRALLKSRVTPVIMPLAVDKDGELLNANADDVAGAVAAALKAEKLILVTDTVLLADKSDPKSVISEINEDEIENLVWSGIISSGMVPKVEQALDALEAGVKSVHIIDGKQPRSLLGEVLTAKGSGTMIRRY